MFQYPALIYREVQYCYNFNGRSIFVIYIIIIIVAGF